MNEQFRSIKRVHTFANFYTFSLGTVELAQELAQEKQHNRVRARYILDTC